MRSVKKVTHIFTLFSIMLLITNTGYAQVSVLTHRYDNQGSGWDNRETQLNASNLDTSQFGLIFTRKVDDQMYAQPLLVSSMHIGGGIHNVLFLATVNNSIYAYDADNKADSVPFWHVNLTPAGSRVINHTDETGACGGNYVDFSGNMGIVGTPVIDTNTGTIYVVSRDIIQNTGVFQQYFHALDIYTGAEKPGSPVYITAKYKGTGDGSVNDSVAFDKQKNNQRSALMLFNNVVYICWASHCDWGPYHGWMIGYDATTLARKCVYNASPDGGEAGIWMSGNAPVVDSAGYIYLATGNGSVGDDYNDNYSGNPNYYRNRGESLLKLLPSGDSMKVIDFYTPANYPDLEEGDLDYGVDGVFIIPNTTLSLSGSKEGKLSLVDVNSMGKFSMNNDSLKQILYVNDQSTGNKHVHGAPVYYKYHSPTTGVDSEYVYIWAESDSLRQFPFNRNTMLFNTQNEIEGNVKLDDGMPGGILCLSSDNNMSGTGVIWASHPLSGNANNMVRPGRLDAFDARNIKHLLWSSIIDSNRDGVGLLSKFAPPVVANGKVYMGTFSNRLDVYGLFNPPANTSVSQLSGNNGILIYPNPTSSTITVAAKDILQKITITDISGKLINEITPADNQTTISIGYLPAGIYIVNTLDKNNQISVSRITKL
jgi:hypothetical protein